MKRENEKWENTVVDDDGGKTEEKGLADKGKDWIKNKLYKA
jgi:hypothetical protein